MYLFFSGIIVTFLLELIASTCLFLSINAAFSEVTRASVTLSSAIFPSQGPVLFLLSLEHLLLFVPLLSYCLIAIFPYSLGQVRVAIVYGRTADPCHPLQLQR
jgi:hypothetical protein